MSKASKITPNEIDRMRTRRRQGLSVAEIAREVGRCRSSVHELVSDIPPLRARPVAQPERNVEIVAAIGDGESQASVARRFGVTRARVRQIVVAAEKREALALATAAEAKLKSPKKLRVPTATEVEALYVAGGEAQVLEKWPHVGGEVLGALLTEKRIEKVAELRALGWDDGKIGIELGLTIEGVQKHVSAPAVVKEATPEPKAKRRKPRGNPTLRRLRKLSLTQIAAEFNVSHSTTYLALVREGVAAYDPTADRHAERKARNAERDKALVEAAATMTVRQLARRFKLEVKTVKAKLRENGVRAVANPAKPAPTVPVFDDSQIIALAPGQSITLPASQPLDNDYLPAPETPAAKPWLARAGAAVTSFLGFGRV